MEEFKYSDMLKLENDNWWYAARRDLLQLILKNYLSKKAEYALDVGCGTGNNFKTIKLFSRKVYGIDISESAIKYAKIKKYDKLILGNIASTKIDAKFDLIVCLDILEHIEDDVRFIKELYSYLRKGGVIIFSVPAHNYLWNMNDVHSRHFRRYEKKELLSKLKAVNFSRIELLYWNFFLILPYFIFSRYEKLFKRVKRTDVLFKIPKILNKVLKNYLKIENLISLNKKLPNGISIIGICKK